MALTGQQAHVMESKLTIPIARGHRCRKLACMTESECAKMDLWQSPKSSPQILRFLSAEPLASSVPSEDMSMDRTGSLCPYNAKKNFIVSVKYTCRFAWHCLRSRMWMAAS